MTDEADETLSKRAAEGCRVSMSALLERHYERIYRLAWRWCGSRETAEDIAQDVCVKLTRAIRDWRGDAAFTTWLYRIAYTTTLDRMRVNQRMVSFAPSDLASFVDASQSLTPDDVVTGDELWRAVRTLPPQQRDAVLLIYGQDMSHAEASLVLGCSEKTVSWHVHEAKKRLKIYLEAVS